MQTPPKINVDPLTIDMVDPKAIAISGLMALRIVGGYFNLALNIAQLVHELSLDGKKLGFTELKLVATQVGLECRQKKISRLRLSKLSAPYIFKGKDEIYYAVLRSSATEILVASGATGKTMQLTMQEAAELADEYLILVKEPLELHKEQKRFGLKWFIPILWKFRSSFYEILIATFFVQLVALAFPMFSQVVVDKIIGHRNLDTLQVVGIAMAITITFEGILLILKALQLNHAGSRVDSVLSGRVFRRMLALNLRYFEQRHVGQTAARIQELDQIRHFFTGQALTVLLEIMFVVVFVALMYFYSVQLTLVTLGMLTLNVALTAAVRPVMREKLESLFEQNAKNQSFLVEVVSGIQTVKTMALEPIFNRRWDTLTAKYVTSAKSLQRLAAVSGSLAQSLQRLTSLVILWFGAVKVMNAELTVGQLIAFQMVAGQLSAPFMKIVQLWQDFQRVGISVDRLGDLMNAPTEAISESQISMASAMQGHVQFERVGFRYAPDAPTVLRNFSLTIPAGKVIGIVGRSGSGKSTIAKLLDRLYVPDHGRILVDGADISQMDPVWLRRQLGFVLQENFLFSGSIKDNIAIQNPGSSMANIIEVAKMAGAHEFISDLKHGYDTEVGERGAQLSGGQRQRIAIARVLLSNPKILVFDEATSALDNESERIIQANLKQICAGRTVVIIAHRLSSVKNCDQIIFLREGEILELGSHKELMDLQGAYFKLFGDEAD